METFYLITNWAPFYSALTCLMLIALISTEKEKEHHRLLLLFLISVTINWFVMNLFYYIGSTSLYLMPLLFFGLLLNPVLLYHFLFLLTRIDSHERFPKKHYHFVGIVYIVIIILFCFYIRTHGSETTYFHVLNLLPPVRCSFCLIYCVLALIRIRKYRREILNILSNEKRAGLGWFNPILALYTLQVALPLIAIFSGISHNGGDYTNPYLAIIVLMISCQNILLTYNTLASNFEVVNIEQYLVENTSNQNKIPAEKQEKYQQLKQRLDDYFEKEKPYLNSDLKITDLILPLQTNRTSLSIAINESGSMNFCSFVNHHRLKEYERLLSDPKNQKSSKEKLAIQAGFSNYKACIRAKSKENG